MPDITMHTHGMGQLSHISTNPFADPMLGTPEQHFANHLQDHYGMQMQNYSQQGLTHHANHFAMQHCGGQDPMMAMMQMMQMMHQLMQEVSLMKHGAPSAPPGGPGGPGGHETLLEAQARLTKQEVDTKAQIRANEEILAVAELETKMAKKLRESILQSI